MCELCTAKAQNIFRLAQYFREKSAEARLAYYIDKMTRTASSLDEVAAHFLSECRCGGDD
jgi:hypothetical protein